MEDDNKIIDKVISEILADGTYISKRYARLFRATIDGHLYKTSKGKDVWMRRKELEKSIKRILMVSSPKNFDIQKFIDSGRVQIFEI